MYNENVQGIKIFAESMSLGWSNLSNLLDAAAAPISLWDFPDIETTVFKLGIKWDGGQILIEQFKYFILKLSQPYKALSEMAKTLSNFESFCTDMIRKIPWK